MLSTRLSNQAPMMAQPIYTGFSTRPELETGVDILRIDIKKMNRKLSGSFFIASDKSKESRTQNVLVCIKSDNAVGNGEAAPFFGISGDSQKVLMADIEQGARCLIGCKLSLFEMETMTGSLMQHSASRAALDMAFLDLIAKQHNMPLARLINPECEVKRLRTDITIPIVDAKTAKHLSEQYAKQGFTRIKVKVGDEIANAVKRVRAVRDVYNKLEIDWELLIDANEGYSANEAVDLIKKLNKLNTPLKIFEQPVHRDNIEGLMAVKKFCDLFEISVFADESVYNTDHAKQLIEREAVHGFNLKLMKHGSILEALRIADLAIASGLKLMVGGMVETNLAMTAMTHLAAALGEHISWIDLDTPLLIKENHLKGGTIYNGPDMILPDSPGIGVTLKSIT